MPEPYTREERLTKEITTVLGELVVPQAVTDWLRAALRDSDVTETRGREQAIQDAQQECDRLNQRIATMYLDKLDGRISASSYDAKAATWRDEEAKLRRQRRLLTLLEDSATWKGGELETTLRTPFQKLRLSNRASRSEETGKLPGVAEMKRRIGSPVWTTLELTQQTNCA